MAGVKQSVAAFVANFFGGSEKAISEKLTSEEHNQFTSEALKLQEKIDGLESSLEAIRGEKTTLESNLETLAGEKTTLEGRITSLEGEKNTLAGEKTTLAGQITSLEGERDKYKAWFEKQAGAGAALPEGDATSQRSGELTSYNQQALEAWRKGHA